MSIVVSCSCGKSFRASDAIAGKQVMCPVCGDTIDIPRAGVVPDNQSNSTEPILVQCSGCGTRFKAKGHLAGKPVRCPQCASVINIPIHDTSAENTAMPLDSLLDEFPANTAPLPETRLPAARQTPPRRRKKRSHAKKKRKDSDAAKAVRAGLIPLCIGLILCGIAFLIKGIATWEDSSLAADQAIGFGISGIVCGVAVLLFLVRGGKIH